MSCMMSVPYVMSAMSPPRMDSIKSGGVWCRESPPDGDNATRSRAAREPAKSEDDEDDAIVTRSRRLSVFQVGLPYWRSC